MEERNMKRSRYDYELEQLRENLMGVTRNQARNHYLQSLRGSPQMSDKKFVLAALQVCKNFNETVTEAALENASVDLRNDKDVVLAAVRQAGYAMRYASMSLRNDKEFVLAAVANSSSEYALLYVSSALQKDKDVVLAAISNNGLALRFTSRALQNDKEFVLVAVRTTGEALISASLELQRDHDVVLTAVANTSLALHNANLRDLLTCKRRNLGFILSVLQAIHQANSIRSTLRRSSRWDTFRELVTSFPDLGPVLSKLHQKIRACGVQPMDDESPRIFASRWLHTLLEKRWCLKQACLAVVASPDSERNILECAGLSRDVKTAVLFRHFSLIVGELFNIVVQINAPVDSWYCMLEKLASDNV